MMLKKVTEQGGTGCDRDPCRQTVTQRQLLGHRFVTETRNIVFARLQVGRCSHAGYKRGVRCD